MCSFYEFFEELFIICGFDGPEDDIVIPYFLEVLVATSLLQKTYIIMFFLTEVLQMNQKIGWLNG